MTILKVNRSDFILALKTDLESTGGGWYLDSETGEILMDTDGAEDLPEDLHENARYRLIAAIPSHVAFQLMEDFVDSLGQSEVVSGLRDALDRPKPFRRFKDVLYDYPNLPEAWFAFEEQALAELSAEWCTENDIDVEWGL